MEAGFRKNKRLIVEIPKIPREKTALLYLLIELLSASISNNAQLHRVSFFILSNPISRKIVSLVYVKDKPLRHGKLALLLGMVEADEQLRCGLFGRA